jgi:hypothetical protein
MAKLPRFQDEGLKGKLDLRAESQKLRAENARLKERKEGRMTEYPNLSQQLADALIDKSEADPLANALRIIGHLSSAIMDLDKRLAAIEAQEGGRDA